MTVSIANMSQVWLSNTNTYNAIAMSVSTMGNGASANSSLLVFNVDGDQKFRIDAVGRIRIPFQPSFSVKLVSAGNPTAGNVVTYNTTVSSDPSNSINTSTGRFTAPVAGKYYFSFNAFCETGSAAPVEIYMRKNGTNINRCYMSNVSGYSGMPTLVTIATLSAGDYMDIYMSSGSLHGNENCCFSGYLLG